MSVPRTSRPRRLKPCKFVFTEDNRMIRVYNYTPRSPIEKKHPPTWIKVIAILGAVSLLWSVGKPIVSYFKRKDVSAYRSKL